MRINRPTTFAGAAAIIAAVAGIATIGSASATSERVQLSSSERGIVHEATKQFRNIDIALAAGYVPAGECAEMPGAGGMGYHYLNPALAADDVVDPAHPELLVYQRGPDGRLRLGAVEYFVADADQDVSTDADRPALFDRYAFNGPMEGHEPGMPVHYDLHVWLYRHNPAGQLEPWNPHVSC